MAPPPATSTRKFLYAADLVAKGLKTATDNLSSLSRITVEPHNDFGSEHRHKMFVGHTRLGGTQTRKMEMVWVKLGRIPACPANAPGMIYHTSHHNPATFPFCSLGSVDLAEPFCTFWENTRPSRMADNIDNRKGWMKGLCYWYWVADAERRGV
jgi:hypothetical protein